MLLHSDYLMRDSRLGRWLKFAKPVARKPGQPSDRDTMLLQKLSEAKLFLRS
jgi:hypothetical protein